MALKTELIIRLIINQSEGSGEAEVYFEKP